MQVGIAAFPVVGSVFRARLLQEKFLVIEMLADGNLIQLNLGLESAQAN